MNLRRRKKSSPVIPIVALVDILVIVLLFIVATTTFKNAQDPEFAELDLQLPQSDALGDTASASDPSRNTLSITGDKKIHLNGVAMEEANLLAALKELKLTQPEAPLQLEADQATPLGLLVKLWDDLKAAGFDLDHVPTQLQRVGQAP